MGGYGHNLSNLLKNSRRQERKAYDGWTESDEESQGVKIEPVSEEILQEIRDKLKKQRHGLLKRRFIGFGLVISFILAVIVYSTF
ncbi:hypothetical protein [uncultured Aquimarina sp.]|uniref:hypothetical protein n=1 Tax=uncultured Aquimarina sp. TaxID=575652 RepID=UPI00262B8874|nr:hypothetical protein [uncultured Aquimarina sp.]